MNTQRRSKGNITRSACYRHSARFAWSCFFFWPGMSGFIERGVHSSGYFPGGLSLNVIVSGSQSVLIVGENKLDGDMIRCPALGRGVCTLL